jgi:PTH2 family peptidyl-tRNA hydrolase
MAEIKQVILVRSDLKLTKGKIAAQAAHAAVEATHRADKDVVKEWRSQGMPKIAVKVESKEDLLKHIQFAKDAGLVTATITDAGKTCVAPGTMTCGAIGPAEEESIDRITAELKLL